MGTYFNKSKNVNQKPISKKYVVKFCYFVFLCFMIVGFKSFENKMIENLEMLFNFRMSFQIKMNYKIIAY